MNSFKKMAIVIAAALTSTALVIAPASAAPLAVTSAGVANATTATAPATVAVPTANQITSGTSVAIAATADTGTVVSFEASATVKLVTALHTTDAPKTVVSGIAAHSVTSAGSAITVYAYTTTTAVGSVTIKNGSYSTIVYVKGTAGTASNVSVSVPSATAVGTIPTITVLATDVFGNSVLTGETITATVNGSTFADGTVTKTLLTSTTAEATADTTLVAGSKTAALATATPGTITVVVSGATSATAVAGLNAPNKTDIKSFVVSDLNGTIASLNAQLAAERNGRALDAQAANALRTADKLASDKALVDAKAASDVALAKAAATYKAEYNALATKWNKKNPKSKVALKK